MGSGPTSLNIGQTPKSEEAFPWAAQTSELREEARKMTYFVTHLHLAARYSTDSRKRSWLAFSPVKTIGSAGHLPLINV